jgi:hypothetical protein
MPFQMPRDEGIRRSMRLVRHHHNGFLKVFVQPLSDFQNIRGGVLSKSPAGSSASNSVGSLTRARAMATRCSCPPESCLGNPSRSLEHASTTMRASGLNCQDFELTEMVAVSVSQQLQDANGAHSWTARTTGRCFTSIPPVQNAANPRSAFQNAVFPGRCPMSGEAIELSPLLQNH